MSIKCIILVMMNFICLNLSLITILSISSNEPEEDFQEIVQYKIVLFVYSVFCTILIVLIVNPVQGTNMLYPCVISLFAIIIWILHVISLTIAHIYIWSEYNKNGQAVREIKYNSRASFLTFGYVNILFYTVVCISIVCDTISLYYIDRNNIGNYDFSLSSS